MAGRGRRHGNEQAAPACAPRPNHALGCDFGQGESGAELDAGNDLGADAVVRNGAHDLEPFRERRMNRRQPAKPPLASIAEFARWIARRTAKRAEGRRNEAGEHAEHAEIIERTRSRVGHAENGSQAPFKRSARSGLAAGSVEDGPLDL